MAHTTLKAMSLDEFDKLFPNEDACKLYLRSRRWPKAVTCPRCGNTKVWELPSRPWHWVCKSENCRTTSSGGYRFSLYVGTIFENTNYPLLTWFKVLYYMLTSKKGVSALQIQRMIGSAYRTAWYISHRLRAGMADPDFVKLMGIVEIDETFIGGKDKNRHWDKKSHVTGGIGSGKVGVVGAISRKGNVTCQIIENTDGATLNKFVRKAVSDRVELVATDEHGGYAELNKFGYKHSVVRHANKEYVIHGNVHTNSIENFWSLLKRGILGTYHNVSKKYLPLYLNEFMFRHNNRRNADIFGAAVASC